MLANRHSRTTSGFIASPVAFDLLWRYGGFGVVRRRIYRLLLQAALACSLMGPARAQAPLKSCLGAYDAQQRLVDSGDMLGARDKLYVCGAADCPTALQRECIASLAAIEPRIPTLVLAAQDEAGRDLAQVRVLLDGVPWRERLDGREALVNPGEHILRFIAPGRAAVDVPIVAREREKGRVVKAILGAATETVEPPRPPIPIVPPVPARLEGVPAASYALGADAVVGLGSFAYFLASGLSQRSQIQGCTPSCDGSLRDQVNQKLLFADVSWGVSLAAAGAALIVYLVEHRHGAPPGVTRGGGPPALFVW